VFIQSLSLSLADHEIDLPPLYKEMWAFKAAVALTHASELTSEQQRPPSLGTSALCMSLSSSESLLACSKATLGDLYFYAVQKLCALGCALGYLHSPSQLKPSLLAHPPAHEVDQSFVDLVVAACPR
jgi:hypothetical protein